MSFAIYTGYTVTAPAPVSMSTHPICNPQHGGDGWMGEVRGEWRTECGVWRGKLAAELLPLF